MDHVLGAFGLLLMSGLFSGLTLGLMSLDIRQLELAIAGGDADKKRQAERILPLRRRGNLLLCTLLLGNTLVNSGIAILTASFTGGIIGGMLSTGFILIFGEIIPQSVCSRYGMAAGARTVELVQIIRFFLLPVAFPLSKVTTALALGLCLSPTLASSSSRAHTLSPNRLHPHPSHTYTSYTRATNLRRRHRQPHCHGGSTVAPQPIACLLPAAAFKPTRLKGGVPAFTRLLHPLSRPTHPLTPHTPAHAPHPLTPCAHQTAPHLPWPLCPSSPPALSTPRPSRQVLDRVLGEELGTIYSKTELKELFAMQVRHLIQSPSFHGLPCDLHAAPSFYGLPRDLLASPCFHGLLSPSDSSAPS